MVKFTKEHKAKRNNNYFEEGVHEVQIEQAVLGQTQDGKDFVEFSIFDPNDPEVKAEVRLWFVTDKAISYTFSVIRDIFILNAEDTEKDSIVEAIESVDSSEELADKYFNSLRGATAYYSIYANPERNYQGQDGQIKKGYDRNIHGYKPKARDGGPVTSVGEGESKIEGEAVDNGSEFPFGDDK